MRVQEAMDRTGLTRKAIYYYESAGLVCPEHDSENNYRDYSEEDIQRLETIAALRQLDVPVEEIYLALESGPRLVALLRQHERKTEERVERLTRVRDLLGACIDKLGPGSCDPRSAAREVRLLGQALEVDDRHRFDFMERQIRRVFPGVFGRCLGAFLAPFLDPPVDTASRERAWLELVAALDELPAAELSEATEGALSPHLPQSEEELAALERASYVFWDGVLSFREPGAGRRGSQARADFLAALVPEWEGLDRSDIATIRSITDSVLAQRGSAFRTVLARLEALNERFAASRRALGRILAGVLETDGESGGHPTAQEPHALGQAGGQA